jgi:hypothetical protein
MATDPIAVNDLSVDTTDAALTPAGGIRAVLRKAFSFPVFLGAMVSVAAVISTSWESAPIIAGKLFDEGDTWTHMVIGQRILATHSWPTVDPYSFTVRGVPWMATEWVGDVALAIANRLGGLQGLAALLVLLAAAIAVLVYDYAWLCSGNHLAAAAATVLVLPTGSACFTMRAQLIGFLLMVAALVCLERFRQGRSKSLWLLPAIFLTWVNTHGAFVLGFLAFGLYLVGGLVEFRCGFLMSSRWTAAQRRHLLFILLLCLLAVTVTPYGTRLAYYPIDMAVRQPLVFRVIGEWRPIPFSAPYGQVFLGLILTALLAQVVAPITYRVETVVLLLFMTAGTFLHARYVIFFAIVFAPVLATMLTRWLPRYKGGEDHPGTNAILIAATVLAVIAFFPSRAKLQQTLARVFPVGAVRYLRVHPNAGNLFSSSFWGGYLIHALPERPVFIDGRADIYEWGGVLLDYTKFTNLQCKPQFFLGKYNLQAALVPRGSRMDTYFAAIPGWQRTYQDSTSVIFTRGRKRSRQEQW